MKNYLPVLLVALTAACQSSYTLPAVPSSAVSITPRTQDFDLNAYAATPDSARSPLSRLWIQTDSPTLYLTGTASLYSQLLDSSAAGLVVLNQRSEFMGYAANHSASARMRTVEGLSSDHAMHDYQIIEATQQRPHDAGARLGGFVEQVSVPKGYSIRVRAAQPADTIVYLIVDSNGAGITTPVPQRDSWPALLRASGKTLIVDGYGWRSVAHSLGTDSQIAAQIGRVRSATKDAKRAIVYIQLGTNDRLWSGMKPAAMSAQLDKLVTGIHVDSPRVTIKLASLFALKEEGDAPAYRQAIKMISQAHPYATYVDGLALANPALLGPDGIHWGLDGQKQQAQNLAPLLR